ncbi:MAG: ArnT family glycosyltransferase, partial [Chthoniobacterales bacterium]
LVVAALMRFAPIRAGWPYSDYIDEGFVLHQVIDQLNTRSLNCRWYGYPTLPSFLVTGSMIVSNPIYRLAHGHGFRRDLPRDKHRYSADRVEYDLISPPELILVGRIVIALISLGTVAVAGLLARELGGAVAGAMAMLLTAVSPALVSRSSNVIVDSVAAFFAIVSLYVAARLRFSGSEPDRRARRYAGLGGLAAGLAVSSKYTAGAVFAALLICCVTAGATWQQRMSFVAVASGSLLLAALCTTPAFIFHPDLIVRDMQRTGMLYKTLHLPPDYWPAALTQHELGIPLVVAGFGGILLMLRGQSTRLIALSWIVFAILLLAPLVGFRFQPFRNLLPLVPPFCVAAALLFTSLQNVRGGWRWGHWGLLATGTLLAASAGQTSVGYVRDRLSRVDTRISAIDWLQRETQPMDSIVALRELAITPAEWKRLARQVKIIPWTKARETLRQERLHYFVGTEMNLQHTVEPDWPPYLDAWKRDVSALPVVASFGTVPNPVYPFLWRTNDQRIIIWKKADIPLAAAPWRESLRLDATGIP